MGADEELEVRLTLHPITLTAVLVTNGTPFARKTFQGRQCVKPWIEALQAIAKATRGAGEQTARGLTALEQNKPHSNTSKPQIHIDLPSRKKKQRCLESQKLLSGSVDVAEGTAGPTQEFLSDSTVTSDSDDSGVMSRISTRRSSSTSIRPSTAETSRSSFSAHSKIQPTPACSRSSTSADSGSDVQRHSHLPRSSPTMKEPATSSIQPSSPSTMPNFEKRMKKLELLIEDIRCHPVPALKDHNERVRNIYNSRICSPDMVPVSMEHFGQLLGELGNTSCVLGVVYGLLSWEVFRREESRLMEEENQSARWAAKRVNDKMSEQSNRRAKAKDWASDGRRAAGMVFGALNDMSAASRSFAILLLADHVTLDGLIKISHFPALRERFKTSFMEIHQGQKQKAETLAANGYRVFDFEQFLRTRCQPGRYLCAVSTLPAGRVGGTMPNQSKESSRIHEALKSRATAAGVTNPDSLSEAQSQVSGGGMEGTRKRQCEAVAHNAEVTPIGVSLRPDRNEMVQERHFAASSIFYNPTGTFTSSQAQDFSTLFEPLPDFDASFLGG